MQSMPFDFLFEALKGSGVKTDKALMFWIGKLDLLQRGMPEFPDSTKTKAETLFHWLWKDRPCRYIPGGSFRLTEVIGAQLNPQAGYVGNCLGLTLLFNSLAQRLGLKVGAIHMEEAFSTGPHVLSLLYTEKGHVQVENIFPDGFDYRAHPGEKQVIWDGKALVADIYNSSGTESFLKGDLKAALYCYKKALTLKPGYVKAKLNMGLTLLQLGRKREATKVWSPES